VASPALEHGEPVSGVVRKGEYRLTAGVQEIDRRGPVAVEIGVGEREARADLAAGGPVRGVAAELINFPVRMIAPAVLAERRGGSIAGPGAVGAANLCGRLHAPEAAPGDLGGGRVLEGEARLHCRRNGAAQSIEAEERIGA